MQTRRALHVVGVTGLLWTLATTLPSGAGCHDRPGTPDNVRAVGRTSRNPEGRLTHEIVFHWRNTSRDDKVWWDIEVRDEAGRVTPLPAGAGRPGTYYHQTFYNAYIVSPGASRCYRIRARDEPGTQGCVSQVFSAWACAQAPGRRLGRVRR